MTGTSVHEQWPGTSFPKTEKRCKTFQKLCAIIPFSCFLPSDFVHRALAAPEPPARPYCPTEKQQKQWSRHVKTPFPSVQSQTWTIPHNNQNKCDVFHHKNWKHSKMANEFISSHTDNFVVGDGLLYRTPEEVVFGVTWSRV